MRADIVQQSNRKCVTVSVADGHEFEFEASRDAHPARLFAERWKHRRLPLNATLCREAARDAAEARFRAQGLI